MVTSQNLYAERQLPYDHDAEAAVLGGLLIDGDALHRVLPLIQPEDFHRARNQYCYAACLAVLGRQEAIDQITVARELAQRDRLETVGGLPYLGQLVANTPTSVNVEHYAGIVADTAAKRRLIDAGHRIADLAFADNETSDEIMRQAVDILFSLRPTGGRAGFRHLSGAYEPFLQSETVQDPDRAPEASVTTGLASVDAVIAGFHPSDLIILGARPGFGKSSLSLKAVATAARAGRVCGIFSLEMTFEQIAARLLAAESGVPARRIRNGLYTEEQQDAIVDAIGRLSGWPVYIDDTPGQTVAEMHSKAQQLQLEQGLDFLVVDYLQLAAPPAGTRSGNANQVQIVSHNSRALKNLARDLGAPALCCSQLSRAPESRINHRPQLADLRDSGSIEQDADLVLFLYREDKYHTPQEWAQLHPGKPYPKGETEVIIAKHRHGPTGSALTYFDEATTGFYSVPEAMAA